LGLSIVKQIVTRLGGEVGFADAPGGGTVFHVELPPWATDGRSVRSRGGAGLAANLRKRDQRSPTRSK
jgi:signal transduction histidine kinase